MPHKQSHSDIGRMEGFSDAYFAIIITLMILELRIPHEGTWEALSPLLPVFLSYILSFVFLGIYWNNHHHLLSAADETEPGLMWANIHLLFWLSLVPFATGWLGESGMAAPPAAIYGIILLCSAIAYSILQWTIVHHHGPQSALAKALGKDVKGKASVVCYALSIPLAFVATWISYVLFVFVSLLWIIPDKRLRAWRQDGGLDQHKHEKHRH